MNSILLHWNKKDDLITKGLKITYNLMQDVRLMFTDNSFHP